MNRVMNAGNFLTIGAALQDSLLHGLVLHLKEFFLAVCRYASACGYCVGR